MTLQDWIALAFLAAVALVIGSFVAVLALRLPAGRSILGRSRCPHCDAVLAAADLVPVASWAVRRGRCRQCGAWLGCHDPVIELAALGIALWAASEFSGWALWASCAFGWVLLALAVIDWRHYLLPDALTLPLVPAGLAVAWLATASGMRDAIAGCVGGYVVFTLLAWAYRRWRGREGLGAGDAKLVAGIGAWVGASGVPSVVLLAAVLALAAALAARSGRGWPGLADRVPFGPFLAAAGWIVWLYGPLVAG